MDITRRAAHTHTHMYCEMYKKVIALEPKK